MVPLQRESSRKITLVLGGARSGKSRFGQRLAAQAAQVTFIATGRARDDEEMARKIARHRADRPAEWKTVEEPLALAEALRQSAADTKLVVIDCLTFWVANLMEFHGEEQTAIEAACAAFYRALDAAACEVVLVSNEVGSGVVPEYSSGRRFRDLAGEINQRVAEIADEVVLMVAGLPLMLKSATVRA